MYSIKCTTIELSAGQLKRETFGPLDPSVSNSQCENAQPQQRTEGSVSADFPKPPAKRCDSLKIYFSTQIKVSYEFTKKMFTS